MNKSDLNTVIRYRDILCGIMDDFATLKGNIGYDLKYINEFKDDNEFFNKLKTVNEHLADLYDRLDCAVINEDCI